MAQPRTFLRQKWTTYMGEFRPIHDIYVDVVELPSFTPTMTPTVTPTVTPTITPTNTVTPSLTPTQTQTPSSTPYICFTGGGFDNRVDISEVDILSPNKLYVGGRFTTYNGITRENITRLFTNGDIDYTWDSGTGFNLSAQVYDIHQLSSGKIYVVGDFTQYRGNSVGRIVRINSDGSFDNTFVQGTGFNSDVKTIQQQSDGKLIVGGAFTSYSGISCTKIARLNTDGTFDSTFTVNSLTGTGNVEKIVVNPDNTIYIGGNIGVSGQTRRNLILLTSGGSYDSGASFNTSGVGTNLEVNDMEITQTNKLMVVGGFTQYNGATNNRIIRLNSDGTKDTSFINSTGLNQLAYDVTEQTDGKYLVCGFFTTYRGASALGVVRINSDGTRDTSFTVGQFVPNTTESRVNVTVDNSGSIYIGGVFTEYSGFTIQNFVKLYPNGTINDCDLVPITPTPSVTATRTPTLTPTNTGTVITTQTPTPTNSPTQTNTPSVTTTQTQTPSVSPTQTGTPTLTPTNTPSATISNCNYLYFSAGTGWASGVSGCPNSGDSYSITGTEFVGYYYLSDDGVGQEKYIDGLGTGATTTCGSLSGTNYSMWIKYPMNSSGITMAIAAVTYPGVQPARNKDFRFVFYSGGTYIGDCGTSGNCLGSGFFLNTGTTENGLLYPATSGFLSSDGTLLPFTIDYFCVTPTPTPSITPTRTVTPTLTPTRTLTPTITSTQTQTPSNTPTKTPTPSVTPCITTITVDNNATNADITGVSVNLTPVTYVSGDNFTVGPSEFGTFQTTITGSPTVYIDYTTTSNNKNINVVDCASPPNVFCLDIPTAETNTWVLEGAELNCNCTLSIVVTDGACL